MSGEHTPGPWTTERSNWPKKEWDSLLNRGVSIIGGKDDRPGRAIVAVVISRFAEADAAIIAAAHETAAERDRLKERCEYGEAENLELAHRNAALETERDGLRAKLILATLNAETFERHYRQVCQDHAGVMATVHVLRAEVERLKEANAETIDGHTKAELVQLRAKNDASSS